MLYPVRALLAVSAVLLTSTAAFATVGTVSCSGSTTQLSVDVSYYKLGLYPVVKPDSDDRRRSEDDEHSTPQLLTFHAPLAQLPSLLAFTTSTSKLSACTLVADIGGGATVTYAFHLDKVRAVSAVGGDPLVQDPASASYLNVLLDLSNLSVTTASGIR